VLRDHKGNTSYTGLVASLPICLSGTLLFSGEYVNTGTMMATVSTNLPARYEISGHIVSIAGSGT
jgi:hypothetical protein